MNGLIGAVVAPLVEVVLHRTGGRQVVGQQVPLAAAAVLVQDRVHDLPHRVLALVATDRGMPGLPRCDHGLDQGPLLVGDVTRVRLAITHPATQANHERLTGNDAPTSPHRAMTSQK
jgi:hypothetical protein